MVNFIDIGGWKGSSAKNALQKWPDCQVYSFEPHPENFKELEKIEGIQAYNVAAWINDGKMPLYCGLTQSHSLYKNKITGQVSKENWIDVEAIDFKIWVLNNINKNDYNILKINAEGAEYALIPYIEDILDYFNEFYVQWHWNKIGLKKKTHQKIKNLLPNCEEWGA